MKSAYSLLELLIVISIVAIFASTSFPVMFGILDRAKIVKTKHQIAVIETAIKGYQMEYGHVPLSSKLKDSEVPLVTDKKHGKEFIQSLMGGDDVSFSNRRGIRFYEPKYTEEKKDGWNEKDGLFDPWGNPYHILVDANGDGMIDVSVLPSKNASWHRSEKSKSKNKNKIEPQEIISTTAIVSEGKDDPIKSWK